MKITDKMRLEFLLDFNAQFVDSNFDPSHGWRKIRGAFFPYTITAIDAAIRASRKKK